MVVGRTRTLVLLTVLLAIIMVGAVAACSSSGELSDREVATRDKIAADQNRVASQKELTASQRRLAQAFLSGLAKQQSHPSTTTVTPLEPTHLPTDGLCTTEPRAKDAEARRAQQLREQARRRALYNLNLTCGNRP